MSDKYILNIYIAAPGTPLANTPDVPSLPGHMYYGLQHGNEKLSFGLGPTKHGDMNGPGTVYTDDAENYKNPRYTRVLEVTREQYEKLKEFGKKPDKAGFDTYYKDARNNCVDFTWGALNHAGLHKTDPKIIGYDRVPYYSTTERVPDARHEGSLKPLHNIDDVQSIQAPVPNSLLNKEHFNPMPERKWQHRLLSENELDNAEHPLIKQALQGLEKLPADSFNTDQERQNAGVALGAKAEVQGFTQIDHVAQSMDNKNLFAIQGAMNNPAHLRTHIDKAQAIAQPVEVSMAQLQNVPSQIQSQNLQEQRKVVLT